MLVSRQLSEDNSDRVLAKESEPVAFSHVQLFVDRVEDLRVYKAMEKRLNDFADDVAHQSSEEGSSLSVAQKKQLWAAAVAAASPPAAAEPPFYCPQNRDVVMQLLSSFGFRVTGARFGSQTRSVLVTSRDPRGVQIIVTALCGRGSCGAFEESEEDDDSLSVGIFAPDRVQRFLDAHRGRQGVGVLAFAVESIETIKRRYEQLHPALMASYEEIRSDKAGTTKVLEVFACYARHDEAASEVRVPVAPDKGTILRFVQFAGDASSSSCSALGLRPVEAVFDTTSQPAYCDHWVSNVFDRTEFLKTLEDTLGFTPKVDFNAGVVAAGEAQIESTVTGNETTVVAANKETALRDQSQVYLPINNALSSVGHVHGFLQELGQGVQHVASRVEDLVGFVQRGNEYREVTGEGQYVCCAAALFQLLPAMLTV